MAFSTQVLLGLGLGILTGIGIGEHAAVLGIAGRAFVLLLQMAVLPFVSVSLIAGLGGLNPGGARLLVRYAGTGLLALWAATLAIVLSSPLAFPDWSAASFFSTSLIEEREPFDFVDAYIPSNPFRALSDGIVPAVVVFSLAFGAALMGSERKRGLVEVFLAAQDALRTVTSAVVRLAPYGIFAIAAEAAGTMELETFAGLQVYFAVYIGLGVIVAFWIIPWLVISVTPLGYREVLGPTRDALITAFATGSLFVVLPILADAAKQLLVARGAGEESERMADVVVPIAFTLASSGKLLGLIFVLFAGWLSGYPVSVTEYPELVATGVVSFFAGSAVAIPFLLDLFRIPLDTFSLYLLADSVVGGRFSALVGSVHILALVLLAGCGAAGWVRLRPRQLAIFGGGALLLTLVVVGGIRVVFESFDAPYAGYRKFIQRSFLLPTVAWRDIEALPTVDPELAWDALTRIRERGVLRVAYAPDRLPHAFRNELGELVGFDVEMAHALARDLGVPVDFYRIDPEDIPRLLDSGAVDVAMTGLAITPRGLEQVAFSRPYLEETLAFIVRDHRREEFGTRDAIHSQRDLHLAVVRSGYYASKIERYLPDAHVTIIDSPRAFFAAANSVATTKKDRAAGDPGRADPFDALVYAAEAGSAWTLIYPQFAVAVPHPDLLRVPLGYAASRDDPKMADFLSAWILLKEKDQTIARLFRYWFEGVEPPGRRRRWSVLHDVLRWGASGPVETPASPASEAADPKPGPSGGGASPASDADAAGDVEGEADTEEGDPGGG